MVARPCLALLAACFLLTTSAGPRRWFLSVLCLSSCWNQRGMGAVLFPIHPGRLQKDQMEQNRAFERTISQTQGLLLELDIFCLVVFYLCSHQAQQNLFIKGPIPGSFDILNTSIDCNGLRSVQRIKDWTLFIVLMLLGGWLKSHIPFSDHVQSLNWMNGENK